MTSVTALAELAPLSIPQLKECLQDRLLSPQLDPKAGFSLVEFAPIATEPGSARLCGVVVVLPLP